MTQRTEGATIRFSATLSTIDTSTVLRLPETADKNLPSRGQVAVHGTINGVQFQTVLEPDGNSGHWMRVDDTLQHAAGISAGDTATLDIEVTRDWPEPSVPQDLATALAAAPQKIQDLWNEITPMARWEWVRWVNATKNPDTRTTGRREHLEDEEREETALLFQPLRMHRPGPVEERQAPRARGRPPLINDPTSRVTDAARGGSPSPVQVKELGRPLARTDVRKLLLVTVCLRQSGRAACPARWTPQSVMCRVVSKGACHEPSLPSPQ